MPRGSRRDDPAAAEFLRALGKRVRLLRLTQERTQEEVAQAAGVSRSFLSTIERGSEGVDVGKLFRLAGVLGVSLAELVDLPAPSWPGSQ